MEPQIGKRNLTSWCWQFVSRFSPSINDKNALCLVKKGNGKIRNHLMKWTPSDGSKEGTGTSGLIKDLDVGQELKDEIGTPEERKSPIRAAIFDLLSGSSSLVVILLLM